MQITASFKMADILVIDLLTEKAVPNALADPVKFTLISLFRKKKTKIEML